MKVECKICFKKFHDGNILRVHLAIIHAFCNICDTQSSARDILAHLKNIHFLHQKCQTCQTKRLKCQDCYFSTRLLKILKTSRPKTSDNFHQTKSFVKVAKLNENSTVEIICQKCDKKSNNMNEYRNHFLAHFEEMFRTKNCSKCVKSFGDENSVRSHIFVNHEKYLPPRIKCQSCKFTTRSVNILRDHCKLENHQFDEKNFYIKPENLDIQEKENICVKKIEDTPKNFCKKISKRKSGICEPNVLRF